MATRYSVFTTILGEDRASEVFRKVGHAARTAFAPVRAFNKAVGAPTTGALGRVGSAVERVAGRFRSGLGSITSWLPALGALGSALTLGGLIAMTRRSAEMFDGLATSAEMLAASVSSLAVWRYGAQQTNVEAKKLEKGLTKAREAIFDAASGKNKDVAALFKAMGIPLRDAQGNVKGLEDALDDIAEAFKNTRDEEAKNAAAIALFGEAGAELIPFFNRGRAGLAEWRAEMARFWGITEQQALSLSDLDTAYNRLDQAGQGLTLRLSASLAPALIRVVEGTTDWIVKNRELLGQSLENKVNAIGAAFKFLGESIPRIPLVGGLAKSVDAADALNASLGVLGLAIGAPLLGALAKLGGVLLGLGIRGALVGAAIGLLGAEIGTVARDWDHDMAVVRAAFDKGFGPGALEVFYRWNGVTIIAKTVSDFVKDMTGIDLAAIFKAMLANAWNEITSWGPKLATAFADLMPQPVMDFIGRNTAPVGPRPEDQGTVERYRQAYGDRGLPMPPSPGSPEARAAAVAGTLAAISGPPVNNNISITVHKAAPETTIETKTSGPSRTETNVGYSMDERAF